METVDVKISDERIKICMSCNFQENLRCTITDSNILLKSKIKKENCPEDKWKIDPDNISSENLEISIKPHKRIVNKSTPVDDIIYLAKNQGSNGWPGDFQKFENVQEAFRKLSIEKSKECINLPYPSDRMSGKGIVVCGGGPKYFPSVYVNLRILRMLGCTLPVEVWYLTKSEMDFNMLRILESIPLVKCIDETTCNYVTPIRNDDSDKRNRGWQSKVYSIINSSFDEVLFLDADNTPLVDPTFLFNEPEYIKNRAVLWPDFIPCWQHDKNFWRIIGLPYRDEPQVESGQVLVDKKRCWKEINMAKYYCDYSDYYFQHFYGDKEAFHLGWRYFESDYAVPPPPDWINGSIIIQRKFNNEWLFSHRVSAKFNLLKNHRISYEIPHEEQTLQLLDELHSKWKGNVWHNNYPTEEEKQIKESLSGLWKYIRVGLDNRDIELKSNDKIGQGSERLEKLWHIFKTNDGVYMSILGDEGLTCLLKQNDNGDFVGRWENHEKCEVKLIPYGI